MLARSGTRVARGLGLIIGVAADAIIPDPPNAAHPVAWFGTWAHRVEQHTYRDSRAAGVAHVSATMLPVLLPAVALSRLARRSPLAECALTAVTTWAVLGASSLAREGRAMAYSLESDKQGSVSEEAAESGHFAQQASQFVTGPGVAAARERLSHLCGRLADDLDEPELARATIESLAENTADSAVASLFWGATFGVPGMVAHRLSNTLDAMVGHHNARYENFGWAAAHLDDVLDFLPARITGALACASAGAVGGSTAQAFRIMRRDAHDHPSPNGGWCEAAFAGALGVQLGGRNIYPGGRVEYRGLLGDGPRPHADTIHGAARLVGIVTASAAALAAAALIGGAR